MSKGAAVTDADISANLAALQHRVLEACRAHNRKTDDVDVLLATKTVPAERIALAIHAGGRIIGENRVQELAEKDEVLAKLPCERHFIGHLQLNKVNHVLRYVSCVQSVDRIEVADRLQQRLETLDRTLQVLIQVNTSGESSKFGTTPDAALDLVRDVAKHDRLYVRGFMTIGLNSTNRELVRASYRRLRQVRDWAQDAAGRELSVLSMGMSSDLELAIAEGATMIRVGSAVFGHRWSAT
jgi:hypothetical protein